MGIPTATQARCFGASARVIASSAIGRRNAPSVRHHARPSQSFLVGYTADQALVALVKRRMLVMTHRHRKIGQQQGPGGIGEASRTAGGLLPRFKGQTCESGIDGQAISHDRSPLVAPSSRTPSVTDTRRALLACGQPSRMRPCWPLPKALLTFECHTLVQEIVQSHPLLDSMPPRIRRVLPRCGVGDTRPGEPRCCQSR